MADMIDYSVYLDKVYGCFIGKTLCGTIGAPYEGVKMPMEIPFKRELLDASLPNDDLDLQILWLDAAEKKGPSFTSRDLLEQFVTCCDYSPGEYAVMRKNYQKGIYPPLSGCFSNGFYIEGMGCPIRSEIWACLAPCDPRRAAEFASRDGCLDHCGESINAERFLAALQSLAFREGDINKLIETALRVVPEKSKFAALIRDVQSWCGEYKNISKVKNKLLFKYGHPDCTNMYQNMGIAMAALLLCGLDMIKTCMTALSCGFDTDCTCATVGAVIGVIKGGGELIKRYSLGDIDKLRYVLGVRSGRRSDRIYDLAEDVAKLGAAFTREGGGCAVTGAPKTDYRFERDEAPVSLEILYGDDTPSICFGGERDVYFKFENKTGESSDIKIEISAPDNFILEYDPVCRITAFGEAEIKVKVSYPADAASIYEKNIFGVKYSFGGGTYQADFGLSGDSVWKVIGPFWRTEPVSNTALLISVPSYWHLMKNSKVEGSDIDRVRHFHLDFAADAETEYITPTRCFSPEVNRGWDIAEVNTYNCENDWFELGDIAGFSGPCAVYMCRRLLSPDDMKVCVQIGHTAPYSLYINGELVSSRYYCDTWTSENVHLKDIPLKKGKNEIVFRVTKVNADAKFSLIFSKGETCAEHYVCFGSENPALF